MNFRNIFPCILNIIVVGEISVILATDCIFPKHLSADKKRGEDQIEKLNGNRYQVEDQKYIYVVGICTDAIENITAFAKAGIVQTDKANKSVHYIVGKYDETQIMAGTNWVMLTYEGGDLYGSHCKDEKQRRGIIMFVCDESETVGQPKLVSEENEKSAGCYYLFEFSTNVVCPPKKLVTFGLSVGSVVVIVFFCVAALYLILGFLYNRFVLRAKGMEQFPNYSFWKDFGNLQADGCALICRSGPPKESRSYKGIGDDQLQESDERDDHLLPM